VSWSVRSSANREPITGAISENATQMYASGVATRNAQIAATENLQSSSLEYAVNQVKSHKLATAVIALALLGAIVTVGYFAFGAKVGPTQIESIAVLPFINQSGNADVEYSFRRHDRNADHQPVPTA